MTDPVRGVRFEFHDARVDVHMPASRGFSSMSEQELADLYTERLAGIEAGFADDGAYAREMYMAGGLMFMGQ